MRVIRYINNTPVAEVKGMELRDETVNAILQAARRRVNNDAAE